MAFHSLNFSVMSFFQTKFLLYSIQFNQSEHFFMWLFWLLSKYLIRDTPPRVALSSDTRIKFLLNHIWFSIISKVIHGLSSLVLASKPLACHHRILFQPWVLVHPLVKQKILLLPTTGGNRQSFSPAGKSWTALQPWSAEHKSYPKAETGEENQIFTHWWSLCFCGKRYSFGNFEEGESGHRASNLRDTT